MEGAKGVLFIVSGGPDLSMHEVNEAAKIITASADSNAKIIFGTVIDKDLADQVKITVIATGFEPKILRNKDIETKISTQEKTSYKPSQFLSKENQEIRAAEEKPKKKLKEDYKVSAAKENEEEDLDIPAFIRKKMM
jgi:cell division protein FtsZ